MKLMITGGIVFLFFVFNGIGAVGAAEDYYRLSELGRAPLLGFIRDKFDLEAKMVSGRDQIIDGFRVAQPGWDVQKVFLTALGAVRHGNVEIISLARGQRFQWMIFRGGKVLRRVQWDSEEPLEGFLFSLLSSKTGRKWDFFLPSRCGNLALIEGEILFLRQSRAQAEFYSPSLSPPQAPAVTVQVNQQQHCHCQCYHHQAERQYCQPPPPPPQPPRWQHFFMMLPPPPPPVYRERPYSYYHREPCEPPLRPPPQQNRPPRVWTR